MTVSCGQVSTNERVEGKAICILRGGSALVGDVSEQQSTTMAVSLSSSSTITPITLQPKLKPIHSLGTLKFSYLVNSHLPKTRTDVSLRRSAVVASAITAAFETEILYSLRDCIESPTGTETADLLEIVKVSDLRGNEIPILIKARRIC
ncbi:hypothetical protein HID58_046420 [Brassica napus]|uniref:Uncharacterized protein n=1 Tax=Brassica napus TaxID=3708 RepID=A0ABQ8AWF9_BRANA|nr:hypothetical protein HID58_046420 [Brassica napus]